MKKYNKYRKIIVSMLIFTMLLTALPIGNIVNATESTISMGYSGPTPSTVKAGGSVTFTVYYSGDVRTIGLYAGAIRLNGFTANIGLSGSGNARTITLSNVQGAVGGGKTITIASGTAAASNGDMANGLTTKAFTIESADNVSPVMTVSGPNAGSVKNGATVSYTAYYSDNVGISAIGLYPGAVRLNGFTANVSLSGSGNSRTITLSNVQGAVGGGKSITIASGTATDAEGNMANGATSGAFAIESVVVADNTAPVMTVSGPNPSSIKNGATVTYTANYSDNVGITNIGLYAGAIRLNGFTANISLSGSGNSRTITLSNVQGSIGGGKTITIASGTATDAEGNLANGATSGAFSIVNDSTPTNPTTPTTPTQNIPSKPVVQDKPVNVVATCDDKNLGDVNPEITYFASWLRAEKYTKSVVQENNYVAEDETMTYMVEYYNGSTAPTPNVKFTLTIPEGTKVEEINGNGKVLEQTSQKTVVEWNVGQVEKGKSCRLYVRVRFLADENLVKSDDISKVFYPELLTNANGNTSYSYMRQQFVDKSISKTGTFTKYLMALDTTNAIRPDDEITRAEFAKLLADCGILKVDTGSTKYKTFNDADKIPEYARDAVSALVGTDIIQAYPDGSFKPNNPILREDLMQMVANAATYMSGTKLTVTKPVFLYSDILKDKSGNISANKDFIMELVRQNVVPRYSAAIRPDEYAKRLEAVTIINSLTFRGPFVQNLPKDTMKFTDIMDHKYFYDLVGASNTYVYNYDYRLWQNITAVK